MQCRCEVAHQNSEHPLQVTLKAKDNQCDKLGIIAGTISCHIDNLWSHQGWQSYLINDHLILFFCVRGNWVSWPICVTKMVVFALYIYHKYMWDDHRIFYNADVQSISLTSLQPHGLQSVNWPHEDQYQRIHAHGFLLRRVILDCVNHILTSLSITLSTSINFSM